MEIRDISDGEPSKAGPNRRAVLRLAGRTAMAGALIGTRERACSAFSDEEQAAVRVIDTHIHAVASSVPGVKPKPKEIEELYEGPVEKMADRLTKEMSAGKITSAFGIGSLGGTIEDPLGIARTLKLCKKVKGLRAVGIADPRHTEPEWLKAVEAQIDKNRAKIVALKAYLGYVPVGPNDLAYVPYYSLAQKYDLPVIVHTGDNWSTTAKVKYAHPLGMDEVAVTFPNVRFVLAHFGNPWLIDAAEVLFKNENVWADLSGLYVGDAQQIQDLLDARQMPNAVPGLVISDLKKAIGYVGKYEKFLYGSDWPLAPMGSYRRLIASLIPKAHHREVFQTNAECVFKIKSS
jgi:predicted TIM-barrel fold metal-dependent hydrolase